MKVKNYKNGATLIYRHERRKHTSVTAGFIFGKNRDKYPEPTAHFCEHMFFKETKNLSHEKLVDKAKNIFSIHNAHTGIYHTCIDFCRSNKLIQECFELASEMLLNTRFIKKHVENEKGVIKQELTRGLNDIKRKFGYAYSKTVRTQYNSDFCVLGTFEEIDQVNTKTLKKFRDETFISQNFFICIRGGISYHKAKKLSEKYFINKLNSNPTYPVDKNLIIPNDKKGNLIIEKFHLDKTKCQLSFKIPQELETTKSRIILKMIARLSNGINGIIGQTLRDSGLVYSTNFAGGTISPEGSFFALDFQCSNENTNKVINKLGKVLIDYVNGQITDEMIKDQKKKEKYEEDEISGFSIYPNNDFFTYFKNMEYVFTRKYKKQYKKEYNSLKAADIQEFIKTILSKPENLYVTILSNKGPENFYTYEQMQKKLMCPKLKTK